MNLDNIAQKLKLNEVQKSNLQLILTECESYSLREEQTAYVIATAWHECKLIPCEEIGKGKGKPYGKKRLFRNKYSTLYGKSVVSLRFKRDHKKQKRIQCGISRSNFDNVILKENEIIWKK